MKYTALYWALRFVEKELDVHEKEYNNYKILIYAEKNKVDYGKDIECYCTRLDRHKDFVILECVDRLLTKGYRPSDITIDGREGKADIYVGNDEFFCEQWGDDYIEKQKLMPKGILYTSRLVSGLLEYKNSIFFDGDIYTRGIFEDGIDSYSHRYEKSRAIKIEDIQDYEIYEDELITYKGRSKIVEVPEGITTIGASAFWNNVFVEEIRLPESLLRIGGDSFYYCTNLRRVNIPRNVWIMGNNPFAACPELKIENDSEHFILENDILYDRCKKNLIHYSMFKQDRKFTIPSSVNCIGKHAFFACENLEELVIPSSVIKFENMPFSGCTNLRVNNNSSAYIFENGIIYNKFKTSIIGCLQSYEIKKLVVPKTVSLISRNSFWNCKKIEEIIISENVDRIGYNPFVGCENLYIKSDSMIYKAQDGIIYREGNHIQCTTNRSVGTSFTIPDDIEYIDRGAFSGCTDLREIDLNNVIYIDKSAFTNCLSLEHIYIPDSVKKIEEWAFSYCKNLKTVSVSKETLIGRNVFNESPVSITKR